MRKHSAGTIYTPATGTIFIQCRVFLVTPKNLPHRTRRRRACCKALLVCGVDGRILRVPLAAGADMNTGLDSELIETYPTFYYSTVNEFRREKYGLECAICLGEFNDDNLLRLLTICCHVFHKECVDLWFESHKTCPFCRGELDKPRQSLDKSPLIVRSNPMHEIRANQSPLQDAVCIDIREDTDGVTVGDGEDEAPVSSIQENDFIGSQNFRDRIQPATLYLGLEKGIDTL
ncbi:RING-H2 finger protein ATL29 [Hibiscus syriacus]|uniref:RING-type E3 ubiquitin transferase n=1 Tax=Hibiscus syriacus TaxID=106335 RepID=A0A6A3CCM9_HIBSY|nr:RING-H2 finger protein ATL29 [Hibiscus syriacus]